MSWLWIGIAGASNIVYNLVTQKLKGSIKCESEEGKGTLFKIRVPVGKDER